MTLPSPSFAVVGSKEPERLASYLEVFGFTERRSWRLATGASKELYGLEGVAPVLDVAAPEAPRRGFVRLVETPFEPRPAGPYDHRPLAIDLYTTDIDESLKRAEAAGARLRPLVEFELGPLSVREAETVGPDGLIVVLIEVNQRRPSLLDEHPERLHSELHSVVFVVGEMAPARRFWSERAGLRTLLETRFEGSIVSDLLELPRPNVPADMYIGCDDESRPARFELLAFPEDDGVAVPPFPLAAGLYSVGFEVASLELAAAALADATMGEPVGAAGCRVVRGVAPGGVPFELWETR